MVHLIHRFVLFPRNQSSMLLRKTLLLGKCIYILSPYCMDVDTLRMKQMLCYVD